MHSDGRIDILEVPMGESNPAYLEVIDFLTTRISPESLIAARPSEAVQERVRN